MNQERLWLIRNSNGAISGPMVFTNLKEKLTSGQVSIDAELCPENGHWFTFHDMDDMKLYFNETDLVSILKALRGSLEMDDDSTRSDIPVSQRQNNNSNVITELSQRMKTPFGLERVQFFLIFFFGGVIAALLIIIWMLNRLES